MKKIKTFIFLFVLLAFITCRQKENYQSMEGMVWNTVYHITFQGPVQLKDSVIPVLDEVSRSLSVFDRNSLVTALNESDSVVADPHLVAVYDKALLINKISKGNFDPTISPLIDAWGFGIGHVANADTLAVDSVLQFVGIDKTHRDGSVIFKDDSRTRFNFSAIAKGYGCDAIGDMFKRNGVVNFMVEIGGEIALSGLSPSGSEWRISIDAPVAEDLPGHNSAMIINVTDAGVATSGNYRNFRNEGGTTVAHTISPISGRPFLSGILSATVIAPTCMEADALATACMASPESLAKEILLEYDAEGLLIFADTVWETPGFRKFISTASVPGRRVRN